MKPQFHRVPIDAQSAFSVRHDIKPNFGTIWHYHPELELHYVIRGEGVRFIGDNVSNFSTGELLLLGENLPHTWRCNKEYFDEQSDLQVEAIVIQFRPDCLGNDFLNMVETHAIRRLYEKAKQGLLLKGEVNGRIAGLMQQTIKATPLQRLSLLLTALTTLAESDDYETIATAHRFYQSNEAETVRLNRVCSYTMANYGKDITLDEIASVANLSTTSFCRYFKMMTHKTYHDFLLEIRINHACRALIDNQLNTEMICFDSGFNNLSNFYRQFKRIKGVTPSDYRLKYSQEYI
ncbi:AraC family transcriptional regulator [Spirosoma knui]